MQSSSIKHILVVVGTRPNFIKITQFRRSASVYPNIELKIVHTGQHYDSKMADVFFEQFGLVPDHFLNVPAGSPNSQMAEIMIRLEQLIIKNRPDLILVVGDVNSTLAAAITANKMEIPIGHIESGLRSFDRTMPEEYNRLLTDELAEIHFVTEPSGKKHLIEEGRGDGIVEVGNTMIDTLVAFRDEIHKSTVLDDLKLTAGKYVLITMHRPSNVDSKEGQLLLLELMTELGRDYQLVFPAHPRTVRFMETFGLKSHFEQVNGLQIIEPLDYFAFQKLVSSCAFVLTDSGGIQEETTFLQIPCLTLRPNTERPVTVDIGSNTLLPFEVNGILQQVELIRAGKYKKGVIPQQWDGKATERIFEFLNKRFTA
jgi:UDP-N-acetylglucosamine 2-epimerase (non-hydrolysing)